MRTSYTLQEVRLHRDLLLPLPGPPLQLTARQLLERAAPAKSPAAVRLLGSPALKVGAYIGYTKDLKTFMIVPGESPSIGWYLKKDPTFGARLGKIWRVDGMAAPLKGAEAGETYSPEEG